jgi:hypothetical protein
MHRWLAPENIRAHKFGLFNACDTGINAGYARWGHGVRCAFISQASPRHMGLQDWRQRCAEPVQREADDVEVVAPDAPHELRRLTLDAIPTRLAEWLPCMKHTKLLPIFEMPGRPGVRASKAQCSQGKHVICIPVWARL